MRKSDGAAFEVDTRAVTAYADPSKTGVETFCVRDGWLVFLTPADRPEEVETITLGEFDADAGAGVPIHGMSRWASPPDGGAGMMVTLGGAE